MKNILYIIICTIALASCDKIKSHPCEISIQSSQEIEKDTISVWSYEQDYHKSRLLYKGIIPQKKLTIQENCKLEQQRVGYILIGNDTIPHYFIIEPGKFDIFYTQNLLVLKGSNHNRELINKRRILRSILNKKKLLEKRYNDFAIDSLLTVDNEQTMYKEDSILYTKMQNMLVNYIGNKNITSFIIKEEFSKYISQESWLSINQQ